MLPRVVVTGMGTINALGHNVEQTWQAATQGVSGVGPVTQVDVADMAVQFACEVKDFDPAAHVEAKETRRRDRFQIMASAACREALSQSGFSINPDNAARVAIIVSSAIGGLHAIEDSMGTLLSQGPRRVSPFTIPMIMSNGAAGHLAIDPVHPVDMDLEPGDAPGGVKQPVEHLPGVEVRPPGVGDQHVERALVDGAEVMGRAGRGELLLVNGRRS